MLCGEYIFDAWVCLQSILVHDIVAINNLLSPPIPKAPFTLPSPQPPSKPLASDTKASMDASFVLIILSLCFFVLMIAVVVYFVCYYKHIKKASKRKLLIQLSQSSTREAASSNDPAVVLEQQRPETSEISAVFDFSANMFTSNPLSFPTMQNPVRRTSGK
mmetsp:Transcript_43727/g.81753  ORF Transcript_43727/g.81753 Transcript_43727/m.81753 type:complete len:161 (+) Transcript_43727:86-568(+)